MNNVVMVWTTLIPVTQSPLEVIISPNVLSLPLQLSQPLPSSHQFRLLRGLCFCLLIFLSSLD